MNTKTLISYACLLLHKDDKILLLKRSTTGWMDGYWAIPGGGVEHGETFCETIIREAQEELDITLSEHHLELAHILEIHTETEKRMGFYFIARDWEGRPINKEPHEHSEIAWFSPNQLPEPLLPASKHVIEHLMTQKSLSIIRN